MKYIDSHTHILSEFYQDEVENELKKVFSELDYIVNISTDYRSLLEIESLINKFQEQMFFAIGIHPSESEEYNSTVEKKILEIIKNKNVIAIGEIGLDYHYPNYDKALQKKVFIKQLELARKYHYPVIIHARESLHDVYEIINKYSDLKFLLHSWNQNWEGTKIFYQLKNVYFGFNGIITFKNAKFLSETLKKIDINRIIFETDSPYLTPVPFRGQKNSSIYVKYVYQFYSQLMEIETEELKEKITQNFKEFFNLVKTKNND